MTSLVCLSLSLPTMGVGIDLIHNPKSPCESQEAARKKVAAFARVPTCIARGDKEPSGAKEATFLKVHLN